MGRMLATTLFLLISATGNPVHSADRDVVRVQTYQTHSRLTLHLDTGIQAVLKNLGPKFEITLPGIKLADIGITETSYRFSDPRIEKIEFQEVGADVQISGQWKFAKGDNAPAVLKMETFDYRQVKPESYVIDFWSKGGPSVGELRRQTHLSKKRLQTEKTRRLVDRTREIKSLGKKVSDAPGNSCELPLSEKQDRFVHFTPYHQKFPFGQYLPLNRPDRDYPYLKVESDTEEAKLARLALDLYQQGKPALAAKTVDFFSERYPHSHWKTEMLFLRANALHRLGEEKMSDELFKLLVTQYPQTPQALHSAIFLAARSIDRGDSLQALEQFMWLTRYHPQHRLEWVFKMGVAEALAGLREAEKAEAEYQWVIEHAPTAKDQAEAAYRVGDLYLVRDQYEKAVTAYYKALRLYPAQKKSFPSLLINRAESLYWLGQYSIAEREFVDFLRTQSSHPAGWRATFRIAEISDRQAARNNPKSSEFYLRTINEFPHTPGATLARMRLLPCGKHGGFQYETAARFLKTDASDLLKSEEIDQQDYLDFYGIARVLTYHALAPSDEVMEVILSELARKPRDEALVQLRKIFLQTARVKILDLLKGDQKFEAIATYKKYQVYFPEQCSKEDLDFMIKLAQASADLGLAPMSREILAEYEKKSDLNRQVASKSSLEDLESRVENAESAFTEARSLWVAGGVDNEKRIRELLAKVPDETSVAFEKEALLSLLEEKKGNLNSATLSAAKAQMLGTARPPEVKAQLTFRLADLYLKLEKDQQAYGQFKILETLSDKSDPGLNMLGMAKTPSKSEQVFLRADVLAKEGTWDKVIQEYSIAIENGEPSNRLLYSYAMALEKEKKRENSVKVLKILERIAKSKDSDFWKNLAMEALENRTKEGT